MRQLTSSGGRSSHRAARCEARSTGLPTDAQRRQPSTPGDLEGFIRGAGIPGGDIAHRGPDLMPPLAGAPHGRDLAITLRRPMGRVPETDLMMDEMR
jgi:hypothetical protein